jgi:hypothetical protein
MYTELKRETEEEKIKLNLTLSKSSSTTEKNDSVAENTSLSTPPTPNHTSISFNKPSTQKKSLSALVKKSNPMVTQKKEKEQPRKISVMEEIIKEETEKKKRMENLKLNGNKDNRWKDDYKDSRNRDYSDREIRERDHRDYKDNRRDYRDKDRDREWERSRERSHKEKDREYRGKERERERDRQYDHEPKRIRRE